MSPHRAPRSPSPPPEKPAPPAAPHVPSASAGSSAPAGPPELVVADRRRHRPRRGGGLARAARRAVLLLTGAAMAVLVAASPAVALSGPVRAVKTLPQVISGLTAWVVGILALTATLFLTVGGLRYLIAGGDPGEVEKAKTALKSAAVGYALAILAPVIVDILKQVLGA